VGKDKLAERDLEVLERSKFKVPLGKRDLPLTALPTQRDCHSALL
jgi:hypothetical protein